MRRNGLGDVNNSRNVNSQDTSAIKARSGQAVNAGNFQYDVTASGRITAADVMVSKALSGLTTTDAVLYNVVLPKLAGLAALHPQLRLELLASYEM